MIPIHFKNSTVKKLTKRLKIALKIGNPGQIQKICAILMLAKERSFQFVAEVWCTSERTLYNWLHEFLAQGMDSFRIVKRSGRPSSLTRAQQEILAQIIDAGPENYGFPIACWNSTMIKEVIQKEFKVSYNRRYVCALLHKLGYSYQKGKFTPDKADLLERELWSTKTWPEILQEAKASNAALLFVDEVGFPMWGSLGYTWSRQGQRALVKTCGQRKNLKVFGAIEYFSGRLVYKTEENKLTCKTYLAFLKTLLQRFPSRIILIHDNAPYHKSKEIVQFLASRPRLECCPLPTYSPDYNLIEYLWKKAKARVHNKYFPTFDTLKQCVHSALHYFQKNASEVLSLHGVYDREVISATFQAA